MGSSETTKMVSLPLIVVTRSIMVFLPSDMVQKTVLTTSSLRTPGVPPGEIKDTSRLLSPNVVSLNYALTQSKSDQTIIQDLMYLIFQSKIPNSLFYIYNK